MSLSANQQTGAESGEGIATKKDAGQFRVALAMSGAISAGAYTAGVFDFLVRALAEWHARKSADEPEVNLVAFTGASAGGVTAALGAIQLSYGLPISKDGTLELTPLARPPGLHQLDCVLPKLYDAWVVRPSMIGSDGNGGLLAHRASSDGASC